MDKTAFREIAREVCCICSVGQMQLFVSKKEGGRMYET